MGTVARGVRFITGASMVAAGACLIVPFGRIAVDTYQAASGSPGSVGRNAAACPPAGADVVQATAPAPDHLPAPPGWRIPDDALPAPVDVSGDYAPPSPPDRLPAVPVSLGAEGPVMNGNYRSTLAVPPPPLLDAHDLPPTAGPTASSNVDTSTPVRQGALIAVTEPPATYVIRDGDDLTGIATRFYGQPAAAAAIWEANRDVVPEPSLLPIGSVLRMPPPWSIPGLHPAGGGGGKVIEPPRGPAGRMPAASRVPQSPDWLTAGPITAPPAAVPPVTGGKVRLAPGETLESLAVRFYGDRSAATRIWDANRDRLRSPELVVAGMELRLP